MANPEKAKQTNLLKRFGTTDIEEILGPEVLNGTRTLRSRMVEDWGFTSGCVAQWRDGYVPKEIWERIKPFQHTLSRAKAASTHHNKTPEQKAAMLSKLKATNLERYGVENAMQHPEIQSRCADSLEAHYGARNVHDIPELEAKRVANLNATQRSEGYMESWLAKLKATSLEKYGRALHSALPPEEIIRRLEIQKLEPLIPIDKDSSSYLSGIPVRCSRCGHTFTTFLNVSGGIKREFYGQRRFSCCECQSHGTNLEVYLREYTRETHPSAYQWRHIPWLDNQEIDIYIPELNIGFEINGYLTHNSTISVYGDPPKAKDYHAWKTTKCLEHGIKLYHIWHDTDTPAEREAATMFIDAILSDTIPELDSDGTISRDILPDPSIIGRPCIDLGPQPLHVTVNRQPAVCYTSGLWQFQ